MTGMTTEWVKEEMITEEKRLANIETLQFGAYGAGQEFELDIGQAAINKPIGFDSVLEQVRSFINLNDDLRRLHKNRVEKAQEMVERFPNSHNAWLNMAASYINGGQLKEAKEAIQKALQLAPTSAIVKAMLGRILILEGKINEAISIYKEISEDGKNIAARESIAMLSLLTGDIDQAINELKGAVNEDPKKRISLYYNLGIAYLIKRKSGRAISYFRKVLQRDPNHHSAYGGIGIAYAMLGYHNKAEKMFSIAVKTEPADPRMKLNLSNSLASQNKWTEAIEVLSDLVQEFPRYWQAKELLGRAYLTVNRYYEAKTQFNRILEAIKSGEYQGNLSNALNNVGVALMFAGDLETAEELLSQSIEVSERRNTKALMNLVRVYLWADKLHRTKSLLDELKEILGDDKAVLNLSTAYYYLSQNYEQAVEEANKVLRIDATDLDAASTLSCIFVDVYDNYAQAERILRPLQKKHGSNSKFLNNLAYALVMQGKLNEARALLDKISPEHDILWFIPVATRGLLHLRQGDMVEGRRLYNLAAKEAINKQVKQLILQKKNLELGRWYKDIGQAERAKRYLERAAKADVVDRVHTRKALELLASCP